MRRHTLFAAFITIMAMLLCEAATAGNLKLIEKRLEELAKLNRQVVQEAGPLPEYGTVEIEAKILPGAAEPPKVKGKTVNATNIQEKRIAIGKKSIQSIDKPLPYTVQISSSRSKSQCYKVANMLRRAGYPAFTASLKIKDQGIWHRIFIGSFGSKEEAEQTRLALEKDEIPDSLIKSMPYTVQIGRSGSHESLVELRNKVAAQEYLPYIGYARDMATNKTLSRLLVGAYASKEETERIVYELRKAGLEARVVNR